jgi:sulfur carrier protein ThiS
MDPTRTPPRLAIGVDAERLDELLATLPRLLAAGVDGAIVSAPDVRDEVAVRNSLERLRTAFSGGRVLLDAPLALARTARIGALLPERGIATAEARRLIEPGAAVARQVGSPAAASAAVGADLLVVERPISDDLTVVRRIVEASGEPTLAWSAPDPESARARFEAGCEGIVVAWEALDATAPGEALASLAAVAPRPAARERSSVVSIMLDGQPLEVEPETTVTDLLADVSLPEDTVVRIGGVRVAHRHHDQPLLRLGAAVQRGAADRRDR